MNVHSNHVLKLPRREFLQAALSSSAVVTLGGCDLSTDPAGQEGSDSDSNQDMKEAQTLAALVQSGNVPPLTDRLPTNPLVVEPVDKVGSYGGTWNNVISGAAEVFFISCKIGYDYLMTWSRDWTQVLPNLAESVEQADDGRQYDFQLREGVKWSDGSPFTADDVIFAYQHVLSNVDIFPAGTPNEYRDAHQDSAIIDRIDELTVRVRFNVPNALFLEDLASSGSLTAYPRHYLRDYHQKVNANADEDAKGEGFQSWVDRFNAQADPWMNPDLPTLFPWQVTTPLGKNNQVVAERNPYYWKVDPKGRQLPYIDQVVFEVVTDAEVINLQTMEGKYDLNIQYGTKPKNKPLFAQNRDTGGYQFADMTNTSMNDMVIALNLNHDDPAIRDVFRNQQFRIGLSLAIDREEIIDTVYQGQGEPYQCGPRPESTFYNEQLARQHTQYDPAEARRFLDQVLPRTDNDGFRQHDSGTRLSFDIEVVNDRPWWVESLELIKQYWRAVGIDMRIKAEGRSLWTERTDANEHDAVVWTGDAGLRDAVLYPHWYFPSSPDAKYAVRWGEWYRSSGEAGEEPPANTHRQMDLYDEFQMTTDDEARGEIFEDILNISKEEFYTIGTVLPSTKYAIVSNNLHNVPETFYYGATYVFTGPTRCEQYYKT